MPKTTEYPRNQVGWLAITGTPLRHPDTRGVGWGIPENGWRHFIDLQVRPWVPLPFQRIVLSNPFGRTIEETPDGLDTRWPMDFDQFALAEEAGHGFADLASFLAAWQELIDEFPSLELILYLGSITDSPGMTALREDETAWSRRAWRAIQPALQLNASIGFDRGALLQKDSLEHRFYKYVRDELGVRTYIEPHPSEDATHLHGENVIVVDRHWRKAWAKHDAREMLSGEVIRIVRSHEDVKPILDDGHAFALGKSEWDKLTEGGR